MSFEKKISTLWNKFICWLLGHTHNVICIRCGKMVDEGNNHPLFKRWKKNLHRRKGGSKVYRGSLAMKHNLIKYSINLKTNELRRVQYESTFIVNEHGEKVNKRSAEYDPLCVYIDAMNDKNAIRKANNYLFGIKAGVRITEVTK